jgi:prepilin-type N-terminal cleavage/methylation domain-containing protein
MNRGFTLIEIMVSITIFLVVLTVSMGAVLNIFESNRKAQAMRTIMGNLNFAVESMAREMRFGTNYHCLSSGQPPVPSTPLVCTNGGSIIGFIAMDGTSTVTYRKSVSSGTNGNIEKRVNNGTYGAVTAPELIIEDLRFYVTGAGVPGLQPKVLITVKGYSGTGKSRTDFSLQTLVSQRIPGQPSI